MSLPRVAITIGDPAGIGPEIAAKAAADRRVTDVCTPVLYGRIYTPGVVAGRLSADAGRTAYAAILAAVADAMSGAVDAVATAPINKQAFALAGLPWRGHTELLAHLTGAPSVAMMFYADALRVVLATVHEPLAEVPRLITREAIEGVIRLAARELPRFGFASRASACAASTLMRARAACSAERSSASSSRPSRRARATGFAWRGRIRRTRCLSARRAASSMPSSPATTTRG